MRSARIVKPKQYLEIKQLETPKPEDSQVIMKVKSSAAVIVMFIYGKQARVF
jgi:D-arabinose 1-dehydrogenase-like Zn-dependent alcohol dehydrogenase